MVDSHYFVLYRHGTVQYVDHFEDYREAEIFYYKKAENESCTGVKLISGTVEKENDLS